MHLSDPLAWEAGRSVEGLSKQARVSQPTVPQAFGHLVRMGASQAQTPGAIATATPVPPRAG